MSRLVLAFLGSPQVWRGEQQITFSTRKALALLAYLAAERGVHSRDKLAALFWPESDTERSRGALRTALTYLKSALRSSSAGEAIRTPLIINHDTLSFDFTTDYQLDVELVDAAYNLLRDTHADLRTRLDSLKAVTDLYRGDFLDGFSLNDAPDFDEWVSVQAENYHRRMSAIFEGLAHLQFESGQTVSAVDTARSWVAHDSLDEAAHRYLMQLYLTLGNRSAALQVYENCRQILEREFGAKPESQTAALADRIRSSTPLQSPKTSESVVEVATSGEPFVGRLEEYNQLVEAYRAASLNRFQMLVVEGRAGLGKTRLVKEFLNWAKTQGADVFEGYAFETNDRLPYQPIVATIRSRFNRQNNWLGLLSEVWLSELSRLLPDLRDLLPDLPVPTIMDEVAARTRLFEAISQLGRGLAERARPTQEPVVIFIDNIQWADAASLDLLQYVSRRWAEAKLPIFLMFGMRSEPLAHNFVLNEWLEQLERDLSLTRLKLDSLTPQDTLRLVEATLNSRQNPADKVSLTAKFDQPQLESFSQQLFTETEGLPSLILKKLKSGVLPPSEMLIAPTAVSASSAQPHILAVDDDPDIQFLLKTRLINAGYNVTTASSGYEALELFKQQPFDLLVTDAVMLNTGGYELVRAVRATSRGVELPVIMLTALKSETDALQAFRDGVDDFVTKPYSPGLLLAKIARLLRRTQGGSVPAAFPKRNIGSGFEALDKALGGSWPRGSNILLLGEFGSGKSTFARRFLTEGLLNGESGLLITIDDGLEQVRQQLNLLAGGRIAEYETTDQLRLVDATEWDGVEVLAAGESELVQLATTIMKEGTALGQNLAQKKGGRRVLDSISSLFLYFDLALVQRFLAQLARTAESYGGVSTLFLLEQGSVDDRTLNNVKYLMDGVFEFRSEPNFEMRVANFKWHSHSKEWFAF